MAIIMKSMDGFDIAHEALMLKEYGEDVMFGGWKQQPALAGKSSIAHFKRANDRRRTALSAAPVEEDDSFIRLLSSTDFPQCP